MSVFRCYSEKKPGFDVEAQGLCHQLREQLGVASLESVRILNRYDADHIDPAVYQAAKTVVFSEPQVDDIWDETYPAPDTVHSVLAVEALPGQFDQRADSCAQCIQMMHGGERPTVRAATVYVLEGALTTPEAAKARGYLINPVESREAALDKPATLRQDYPVPAAVPVLDGFTALDRAGLESVLAQYALAMDLADLAFLQAYFRDEEGRDPTLTEVRVVDTYWSDHCRHTTFSTHLDAVEIADDNVKAAYERYLSARVEVYGAEKAAKRPQTLMDIATLGVSCLVKLTSDKKMVDDAALAFGVAGPVPMRSPAAEAAVRGLPIGEAVAAIGEAALADVNPRTSWRASKEFRIQLVKELKAACGLPAAASFKHVSPAGAALGLPLTDVERKMYHIAPDMELSPLANAYARARGADRMSSFGDWIALSDICDVPTAKLIQHEVSDGIIAPGYEPEALAILSGKKKGNYNVVAIDPAYQPAPIEHKQVYGITFEQGRNELVINADTMLNNWVTENKDVTEEQKRDLVIALITLKYTQSNSVCYTYHGQTIGVGAGQQSRIHCTRLAGQKADNWQLRHMDKVLDLPFRDDVAKPNRDNAIDVYIGDTPEDVIGDDVWAETFTRQPEPLTAEEKKAYLSKVTGVCLGSDAFFPFGDNIERARRSGVTAIVQPGGSIRDQQVIDTCNKYGIAMAFCGLRLFHH